MGKENAPKPQGDARMPLPFWNAQAGAQIVSFVFYFLFGVQCMILPLVGKSAMQGSYSPGAARAEWATTNILFFGFMLLLMIATGVWALLLQLDARRQAGKPFPRTTAILLGISGLMGLAFVTGAFGI